MLVITIIELELIPLISDEDILSTLGISEHDNALILEILYGKKFIERG